MDVTSFLLGKKAGGGGGTPTLQSKSVTVTTNGTQNVSADAGYDGLSNVGITTNVQPNLETKSVTITENTTTIITPTTGKDGLSSVEVITNVSGSGGHDWSALGYSGEPQAIQDGYVYAVEIMENWDPTATMESKFASDFDLLFMPLVDISKASNLSKMFQSCTFLLSVPALDYSNALYLDYMFSGCAKLKSVSNFNATGRISYVFLNCYELETVQGNIKPTNLRQTFSNCQNLKNIPVIDGSSITGTNNFQSTFQNCVNLTDTSLDNILQTCISATSYNGTKTLAYMGFNATDYPVSRIEALPHYQDFIDAGWTIGY